MGDIVIGIVVIVFFTLLRFQLETTATTANIMNVSSSSQRSNLVRSFKVMDILRKANELQQTLDDAYDEQKRQQLEQNGNDDDSDNERKVVLHLEVGQPDSGAPKYVADAAIKALSSPSSSSSKKKKKLSLIHI